MEKVEYEFVSSRRTRRLRINVYPGRVVVTKPWRVPEILARDFAKKKQRWIRKQLDFYQSAPIFDWKNFTPDHKKALEFVLDRIRHFNSHYQFEFASVKVKNQKRVWGTCSRRRNLNFNSKIIALPAEQADYIIVHELCHLKEFNHSKKFWALVTEQIPDYKRIKKDLKLYSYS